jgi:hypothetical protein
MKSVLLYLMVAGIGTGLLLMVRLVAPASAIQEGEYYLSSTLRSGYSVYTACLFFLVGVVVGYFTRLSPWLTGLALVIVCLVVVFYESLRYRGSHNLLPFELFMYIVFAFPGVVGVYVGRVIYNKRVVGERAKMKGEK